MRAHGRKGAKGAVEGAKPYYKVGKWVLAPFNAFQGQGRVTIEGIRVKEAHKGVGGGYKRDLKR